MPPPPPSTDEPLDHDPACKDEVAAEDGEGGDEDVDAPEDCFFESLDRVPSGISFYGEFPSSSSDDEEDDVRVSFASAIAPPSDFLRRHSREEVEEEPDDDGGGVSEPGYDYGLWMAEPLTVQERRRRLLQGMGLASSKDLSIRTQSYRRLPSRMASRRLSISASQTAAPDAPAAAPPTVSPTPSSPPVIVRCRSDSELLPEPLSARPVLARAYSAPPSLLDRHGSPITRPITGLVVGSGGGVAAGVRAGADDNDGDLMLEVCRIKNLDTGKEFVLTEIGNDEALASLNDLQTGLQLTLEEFEKSFGCSPIVKELMHRNNEDAHQAFGAKTTKQSGRKKGGWLKNIKFVANSVTGLIMEKDRGDARSATMGRPSGANSANSTERLKVHPHKKSYKELTGLYMSQEINAHQGSIWCIKFSSDSRYLASGGEDHVVHVWQVLECNAFSSPLEQRDARPFPQQLNASGSPLDARSGLLANGSLSSKSMRRNKSKKRSLPDHIVIPETIFSLSEKPVCSFHGHLDDVLDLSWSKSQYLLSSSMDKTVRLWDMESKACLKMFAHNDYVTCIQFNPSDDSYFISGSLDAKVRIWNIPERRVVDWTELHEMVTAACYTPDGQVALVGSHKGCCRFYKTSDCKLDQEAQMDVRSKKKKAHAKKITGFQFAPGNTSEVLITSADSTVRVFDGVNMIHKFRGFRNTSSQISASYTSDGRYVICASEDSHVYVWKRETNRGVTGGKSKGWTTTRSHEHFHCKDVSVAIPWPACGSDCPPPSIPAWCGGGNDNNFGATACERSLSNIEDAFPSSRSLLPPLPKKSSSEQTLHSSGEHRNLSPSRSGIGNESFASASSICSDPSCPSMSESIASSVPSSSWVRHGGSSTRAGDTDGANAWGLVVVTASLGGTIRIYQNFGLRVRLSRQTNLFS